MLDSTDRREKVAKHLKALSLPFEWVDAVDGRGGLPSEYESMVDRRRTSATLTGALCDPEIACALSHLAACRRIVESNMPWALILEDDAIPLPDLPRYLETRHHEAFDLVSLFCSKTYVHPGRAIPVSLGGYRSFPCELGVPVKGAVAYILSQAGAKHLLAKALPVASVADWPDCTEDFKARERWHVVQPRLFEHEALKLSIIGLERNPMKRRFLGIYVPPFAKISASWKSKMTFRARGLRRLY